MSYSSEVLADSPWGFWQQAETSGSTLADSSGNGRTATANLTYTLGQPGPSAAQPAVSFTTATGYTATAATFNTTVATVEAWVYLPANPAANTVVAGGANAYRGGISDKYLYVDTSGRPAWQIYLSGNKVIVGGFLSLNTWHHIVGTIGPAGTFLYVDGVQAASGVWTASLASDYIFLTRAAGNTAQGTGAMRVAAPALYTTQLSPARVTAHHAAMTAVDAGDRTGVVAAVGPAHAAALSGTFTGAPVSGTLTAVGPTHAANLSGVAGTVTGTVTGTGPAPTASIVATVDNGSTGTTTQPWTADLSRRTTLTLITSGAFDAIPTIELPPAGFNTKPLVRRSVTVPALTTIEGAVADPTTGGIRVPDSAYDAMSVVEEDLGIPHIFIGGRDVTFHRGGITRLISDRSEEPFGDLHAQIELPRVTSLDDEPDSPDHPLWQFINRANVQVVLRHPDGTLTQVWGGHVISDDTGNDATRAIKRLTCRGSLWQAASDVHRVPTMLEPTDIGSLIPRALNSITSRRFEKVAEVTTGILSRQRGSWSDSPLAYTQGLLSTAWTAGGRQWTVAKVPNTWRTFEMRLKKDTPSWTVTNGARGVEVSLSRDGSAIRNVIYGHGVGADGYAWWNYHYPNLRQDDAPAYPFTSAGSVITVGTTDGDTTSGTGVSDWQRRARELGYVVAIDGVFNTADATTARTIQRRYGLSVDGVVGPQTWAASFDVGGNGGDLNGAIRLPLAADPRTQYWLYNADGSVAGKNPEYDQHHLVYADDVDFGAGVSRAQGVESAQQIVDREKNPGLTGRITLRSDPREGSRLMIPAGDKMTLVGYEGADRVLHITAVERDWDNLSVTLEVDERSRDALTLAQIRERNKEARRDPARRPGNVNRRSRLDVDQVVPFDGESGAGWIPRHALYGGLWTVIRVPVSELGRVAKVDVRTSGPVAKFAVALFGAPIQPAHLVRYVGNPLASDSPFETHADALVDQFGFIEGWGQNGQACGYWPGSESDGATVTGRHVDTGGFEYASAKPPWVWVAEFSPVSTFISGRILPAPIQ